MSLARRITSGDLMKGVYCGVTNDAGAPIAITAAGTGDNTEVTGAWIDRQGFDFAIVTVFGAAALTAAKTLSVATEVEDSSDGVSVDGSAVALQASTIEATGDAGSGSNETFIIKHHVDLRGKERYVRFNATPDLSHSGTDTAIVAVVAHLGGCDALPQSEL